MELPELKPKVSLPSGDLDTHEVCQDESEVVSIGGAPGNFSFVSSEPLVCKGRVKRVVELKLASHDPLVFNPSVLKRVYGGDCVVVELNWVSGVVAMRLFNIGRKSALSKLLRK